MPHEIHEYDMIKVRRDMPELGLRAGMIGVICDWQHGDDWFLGEFPDLHDSDEFSAIPVLRPADVELFWSRSTQQYADPVNGPKERDPFTAYHDALEREEALHQKA